MLTELNKFGRIYRDMAHVKNPASAHGRVLILLLSLLVMPLQAKAQDEDGATDPTPQDREVLLPAEPEDDGSKPSGNIDEMVVRGTGRDDFLKDLSVSQTSFSAAEIKSLRIQNIADLAEYTPNLEINTRSSASNPTLFIRGIGLKDYNANAAGAVAIMQDGISINSPAIQLGQLFDTEQLVVLRGPQGSLNGRNATAGAIMINSVLPDGEWSSGGDFSYGNYNSINVEGAFAFPLVEDLLSARAAFTANFRDGTTENNCSGWDPESVDKPQLTPENIEEQYLWNVDNNPDFRQGRKFPFQGSNKNRQDHDEHGRLFTPDFVCIYSKPGYLQFSPDFSTYEWFESNAKAQYPDDFADLKRNLNNVKNWATRGILRFQPDVSDGMDWVLNFHGGQNLGDSFHIQSLRTAFTLEGGVGWFKEYIGAPSEVRSALNSGGLEGTRVVNGLDRVGSTSGDRGPGGRGGDDVDAGFYDMDGRELLNSWGTNLRGVWDTGPVVLTSLTGYEWYDRLIEDEGDGVPTAAIPAIYEDSAWQVSQELRAAGEGERYRWFVGGYFLYDNLDSANFFPGIQKRSIEQTFDQELLSAAGYASGRYWVLDEFYVDAGLRYNYEKKDFTLASTIVSDGGTFDAILPETVSETWTGLTGDFILAWEPGSDWMYDARLDYLNLYAKYGRGMKGGHFNAGLTLQASSNKQRITPVEPEFIDSIEVGFRSRWFQDRLNISFAAFRYWYQDLQVFDFINELGELPIQQLLNSDARVLGAELEIVARPFPGFMVQFGGGWLETEFVDFVVSKAVNARRGGGRLSEFDYSGHPLIAAPEWSFSTIVEYQIPLGRWGSLVPQYTVSYTSKVYLDPQMQELISQDAFFQHGARLAYRTPDGRFEIAGWVENFLDYRYRIDVFDLSIDSNLVTEVWNDPRMFGFTLSAYF